MAIDRTVVFAVPVAAASLLWPALWNGYPIVFADTGTYLSQAIHRYAGWDRPVFYSLSMLPLHATVTVWPVVIAQALLAAWILRLVCRALLPGISGTAFATGILALSACTWLPWIVSELMPDLFTPLLVLVLCYLALVPDRLSVRGRVLLVGLATFMIATQQSSLPLACALVALFCVAGRRRLPSPRPPPADRGTLSPSTWDSAVRRSWYLIVIPPALAFLALCTVNLAAHGRFAVSPFGNVFLLARVIYDGPGMTALRRECPAANWKLCSFLENFPPTSDDFLWMQDSPLNRAGGAKIVSQDADAIIRATLRNDPVGESRAALANTVRQLVRFGSGDGLNPWPQQVSPTIDRDFPRREQMAYASARQQAGSLSVPPLLAGTHIIVALGGLIGCAILLPIAFKRRATCAGFLLAVLIVLPLSAAITGGLSGPHDRYQARIMWLPPFIAVLSFASLRRRQNEA